MGRFLVCQWAPQDRWRLYAVCRDSDAARRLLVTLITEQFLTVDAPVHAERYNANVVGITDCKEVEVDRRAVRKGLQFGEAYTKKDLREDLGLRVDGRCRVYDALVYYGEEEETDEVSRWQIDCDFFVIELC